MREKQANQKETKNKTWTYRSWNDKKLVLELGFL